MLDPSGKAFVNFAVTYEKKAKFTHICSKMGESCNKVLNMILSAFIKKYEHLLEDFDIYEELRKIESRRTSQIERPPKEIRKRQIEKNKKIESIQTGKPYLNIIPDVDDSDN